MNRLELISKIERAFPAVAAILRERPRDRVFDTPHRQQNRSSHERWLRQIRTSTRRLRAERIKLKLCRDCGQPRCEESTLFCSEHPERRRKYARDYKKR